MHVHAQHTDRELLPDIIGRVLDRHQQRLASRRAAWSEHVATAREFRAAERMASAADRTANRSCTIDVGGYEL